MRSRLPDPSGHRGQVLVIVALGMFALIAIVGLVIDGGYAWGRQRETQNGADAVALAGTTVIAQDLAGTSPSRTDGDVACAMQTAASANHLDTVRGVYVDFNGNELVPTASVGACVSGGGGAIPADAAGVKAVGSQTFPTFLARAIGIGSFTTDATASAIAGLNAGCPEGAGCGLAPITIPIQANLNASGQTCDGSGKLSPGDVYWPIIDPADATAANESIVPLCKTDSGSFGGLDLGGPGCDSKDGFTQPCNASVPIPTWLHTSTGNIKNDIIGLNVLAGPNIGVADDSIILIPMWDDTCKSKPADDVSPPCSDGAMSGTGDQTYYHIPYFTGFMLDQAYRTNGECTSGVGQPYPGGNGSNGCIKGWFVQLITIGPVGAPATGDPDEKGAALSVQLIR